jgi:hypothetical protein
MMLLSLSACTPNPPDEKPAAAKPRAVEPRAQVAPPPPVQPREARDIAKPEAAALEGSGKTAWAKGFEGTFIGGLDGGLYEPYRTDIIRHVQQALKERGLYVGPINGILDSPTMKALYTLQEATHNLQACGVPTPLTRKLLEQGSHTDVTS